MIRAIIFDCFGVLATDGWLPYAEKYFGHDPDLRQKARELNRSCDLGELTYEDFIHAVAQMAGASDEFAREKIDDNEPNEPLFDYIKTSLKPRYKLGMLSNAGANWLGEIFESEQVALFDVVALSYATGFVKPQRQAYHAIARQLGAEPAECIFIDDQLRYVEAARGVGMQAISYQDFAQMKRELEKLLADTED